MEENNLSLYKLDKICDLSINTLRKLITNPSHNTKLESLNILAQVFNCSIKDLIEDDPAIVNYEKATEKYKDKTLYSHRQVFSPENIDYLRKLLLQVGVSCNLSAYGMYKTVSIKTEYELSSIHVDFNLRVSEVEEKSILEIVDFYVSVNQALLNESVIKNAFIQAFEIYARKLKFNEIHFFIIQDFKKRDDEYSKLNSELPGNFTYTIGTDLTQKNYQRFSYPEYEKYQVQWRKTLS